MRLGLVVVGMALLSVGPSLAEPLTADAARRFVAGKVFAFSCFDGTRGAGRIESDGSVFGTMQARGNGPVRQMALPAGTLKIKGDSYCASLRGMAIEPCFNVIRTATHSFRGSIAGLGFAYCDFTRYGSRMAFAGTAPRPKWSRPLPLHASAAHTGQ